MGKGAGRIGLALAVAMFVVATSSLALAKPGHGHHGKHGASSDAHADETHPPGNNGTVKVDGDPFDTSPSNEPHPGCVFEIEFYGYDQGDLDATYSFSLQAPSGSGELDSGSVFIGEDPAGGGRDLDASTGPIDLSQQLAAAGAQANRNQGYHVSLTVHAEGSIGSDVKHKVFWVSDCAGAANGGGGSSPAQPKKKTKHGDSPSDTQTGTGASAARSTGGSAARSQVSAARPARAVAATPAFTG